jgi:hypothetical protein
VGVATERVATTARGVDGANAKVDDAKRQIAAMMAMMFFILAVFELFPFTTIITPEGRDYFWDD